MISLAPVIHILTGPRAVCPGVCYGRSGRGIYRKRVGCEQLDEIVFSHVFRNLSCDVVD